MKYAVVLIGGKQYKVAEGEIVDVDFMDQVKANDSYAFDQILMVADEGKHTVGTPTVPGAKVTASVVGHIQGTKLRVAKFKAKARYRRVTGFRPKYTSLKVERITVK